MMPKLRDDLLYVFVFGPCLGESVLVRIPPDEWLVIDGCASSKIASYPERALAIYGATPHAVVLTHPHLDHSQGLSPLLESWAGRFVGVCEILVEPARWELDDNLVKAMSGSRTAEVLSAIRDIWDRQPASRWALRSGEERVIGEATLRVLHPSIPGAEASSRPNAVSSPIWIEWGELRLLLGSDLEAEGWQEVHERGGSHALHHGLKVPHHGSLGAVHSTFTQRVSDARRLWIVTPYNLGKKLPRFEDGQGMERLLKSEGEISLTGLPDRYDPAAGQPFYTTRGALQALPRPSPVGRSPGGDIVPLLPDGDDLDHYVIAGFDRTGILVDSAYGPGSMVITEQAPPGGLHDRVVGSV